MLAGSRILRPSSLYFLLPVKSSAERSFLSGVAVLPSKRRTWSPLSWLRDESLLKSNYGNIYVFIHLYSCDPFPSFIPPIGCSAFFFLLLLLISNEYEQRKQKVLSVILSPVLSHEPDHHTDLALPQPLASVCSGGDAKNGRSVRTEQTSTWWLCFLFCCRERTISEAWHRGLRDPTPSNPGGAPPLLDGQGGGGGVSASSGVASLAFTVSHRFNFPFLSELVFVKLLSIFLPFLLDVFTSGHKAPPWAAVQ